MKITGLNKMINKEFELILMSRNELRKKVIEDNNITEDEILLFYSFLNQQRSLLKTVQENILIEKKYVKNSNNCSVKIRDLTPEELEKEKEKTIYERSNALYKKCTKFEENELKIKQMKEDFQKERRKQDIYCLSGIEVNPIIININNGKYQLVDGFLRLLFVELDEDVQVMVKFYKDLTDAEFLNELCICNMWKKKEKDFFDRGFLLALSKRFKIDVLDYYNYISYANGYWGLIDTIVAYCNIISSYSTGEMYVKYYPYSAVYNNKHFIDDIMVFKEILNTEPKQLKGLFFKESYNKNYDLCYSNQYFLECIIHIVSTIRYKNKDKKQNNLSLELYLSLFDNNDWVKVLKKTQKMTVSGYIKNNIIPITKEIYTYLEEKLIK